MARPASGFRYSGQARNRLSYNEVKRLAQAYGLPGDAIAQIAKGESGMYADVQQRDPGDHMIGYGLLQMTPNAWGKGSAAYKRMQQLGGIEAMKDPAKNMAMARFLYRSAGNKLTPWYGTRFLTNRSGEGTLKPVNRSLLRSLGISGGDPNAAAGGQTRDRPGDPGSTRTTTTITPGVDNSQARAALVQQFLGNKNSDVLDFAVQARQLKDIPEQRDTVTQRIPGSSGTAAADPVTVGAKAGGGAARALTWAQSKIGDPGARETGGANRGKLPDFLNQRFGFGSSGGQPWCAMFTSAAVTKGGAPPSARTASVAQVRQKAQAGTGYVRGYIPAGQARPGDLVLFGNSHIAMVTAVRNGKISYVGGNQSNAVTKGTTRAGGSVSVVRPKYGARH